MSPAASAARITRAPARPVLASQPAGPARPALTLVQPSAAAALRRMPFLLLTAALLTAGLFSLLMINTALAKGAFVLRDLSRQADALGTEQDGLQQQLDLLESPNRLAATAEELGMVPSQNPVFIRVSDGAVLGVPVPAKRGAALLAQASGNSRATTTGPRAARRAPGSPGQSTLSATAPALAAAGTEPAAATSGRRQASGAGPTSLPAPAQRQQASAAASDATAARRRQASAAATTGAAASARGEPGPAGTGPATAGRQQTAAGAGPGGAVSSGGGQAARRTQHRTPTAPRSGAGGFDQPAAGSPASAPNSPATVGTRTRTSR